MAALKQRLTGARNDRGAELIELAIVLPLLLMIVAGIMDFGFLFQRYEVVTNAAREGARLAVLPGYSTADVQDRVKQYLENSGLTVTDASSTTDVTSDTETLPDSSLVVNVKKVTVSYPSQFMFLGPIAAMVGGSGWTSINLTAASTMRVETGGS